MRICSAKLSNWRNFTFAEANLSDITYMIGPNASGKSNFLDVFRFLRDIALPQGGGLQKAIASRGGLKSIRCVAARRDPTVKIELDLEENSGENTGTWKYILEIGSEKGGKRLPVVSKEIVIKDGKKILERPDWEDKQDIKRLSQTALEQINSNKAFRSLSDFFADILYLHLVPQLLRYGDQLAVKKMDSDPFGQGFLERLALVSDKTRKSRLKRIEDILKRVIHGFEDIDFERDKVNGTPHLQMRYAHWRHNGAWQREDQFSDGTLRLIALLWTLMESNSLILLEEPELSLHKKIVEQIPRMLYDARQSRKAAPNQILVTTHSSALLSGDDITGTFLILAPTDSGEGTSIKSPSEDDMTAMRSGMSPADIILPRTEVGIGSLF